MMKDSKLNSERKNIVNICWVVNTRQRTQRQIKTNHTLSYLLVSLVKQVKPLYAEIPWQQKTKDLYNDQTYESIKTIMSYSISLQMISKNAIIFYQKNISKHTPSPTNWSSFTSMHSRLPTSITNYLAV